MELSDMNFARGFSRPVFRVDLVPIFVNALRAMGLPDWVMVREKLYTHYADQVIELLVAYKNAFVTREFDEKVWYGTKKTYPLNESAQLMRAQVEESKRNERNAYQALCVALSQQSEFVDYEQHAEDWSKVKIDCR
jgi:hypothetical protein